MARGVVTNSTSYTGWRGKKKKVNHYVMSWGIKISCPFHGQGCWILQVLRLYTESNHTTTQATSKNKPKILCIKCQLATKKLNDLLPNYIKIISFWTLWPLKMKAPCSFETSRTVTQRPNECPGKLKSPNHDYLIFFNGETWRMK